MAVLHRTDPEHNMHRFYRMVVEPGLFGEWALTREWGRAGTHGRRRHDWFAPEAEARAAMARLKTQKRKRGYRGD